MNEEKRLKAAAPGRPSSRWRRLPRPKSGNIRLVLLCFALLFQVLSFAKHTGVSVFGIPISPDQESGLPIKTDRRKPLDREEVTSLAEGSGLSAGALSLPDSTGGTARGPRETSQAPSVRSAQPTGPSSGAGVPSDPALTEPSLPADPQPVAAGGGGGPTTAPGGEPGKGDGGGTGEGDGGGEGGGSTEGGGSGEGGGGTGGGGGGEVETAENGGGDGTGEEPGEIETDVEGLEGPLVTSARRGSPPRPVRPIPRLR